MVIDTGDYKCRSLAPGRQTLLGPRPAVAKRVKRCTRLLVCTRKKTECSMGGRSVEPTSAGTCKARWACVQRKPCQLRSSAFDVTCLPLSTCHVRVAHISLGLQNVCSLFGMLSEVVCISFGRPSVAVAAVCYQHGLQKRRRGRRAQEAPRR